MHDSYDIAAMRWGKLGIVYLDAGRCDVDLHHNLLWAAPGSLQRGLWYNTTCVDIHERLNVFHPGFTRTCAELTPTDFPEGQAFRFGHDFEAPPPVPEWPPLVSHNFAIENESSVDNGLTNDASYTFGPVDWNAVWQSAILRLDDVAKDVNTDKSRRAQPRHRNATDPLVLEATVNDGLAENVRKRWTFIYNVGNKSWVRFNQVPLGEGYRRFRVVYGNATDSPRHVEVRLDSVDGPLVGSVPLSRTDRPRTGCIQIYGEAVAQLGPEATGNRDLFFVFHASDDQPVGEFEYFRLEQYRGELPLGRTR